MYCYKCGYELKDVTNFCGKCGSKNIYNNLTPNEKKLPFEANTTSKEINAKQTTSSEIITKQTKLKPKAFIILGVLILLLSVGFGSYYISISKFFSDNSNSAKKTPTENKIIPNNDAKAPEVKSEDAVSVNKTDINDINSPEYYFFPISDSEKLLDSDVSKLDKENLTLAKNEIYARHGYVFKGEQYKSYFINKSWYKPNPNFNDGDLNNVEIYNIQLISKHENK